MQGVSKITGEVVLGRKPKEINLEGKAKDLYTVYGFVDGGCIGQTTVGRSIKLTGEFKAVNLETGETFHAPAALLPGLISESLYSRIRVGGKLAEDAPADDDPKIRFRIVPNTTWLVTGEAVAFGCRIGMKPGKNGNEYFLSPIYKEMGDRFKQLEDKMSESPPADD